MRRIFGGYEYMIRDGFEKMWRWLYFVVIIILREGINVLWVFILFKWIEGFVIKEEVEYGF